MKATGRAWFHRRSSAFHDWIARIFLMVFRHNLEKRMTDAFDPVLSQKLDCVMFLIEN